MRSLHLVLAELPGTGPDGLGTIVLAALGITMLGVVCLVVAARLSRDRSD